MLPAPQNLILKSKQTANICLSSWNSQSHLIGTTALKEPSSLTVTQESTRGSHGRVLIPGADVGGGAMQEAPGEEREACRIQTGVGMSFWACTF